MHLASSHERHNVNEYSHYKDKKISLYLENISFLIIKLSKHALYVQKPQINETSSFND